MPSKATILHQQTLLLLTTIQQEEHTTRVLSSAIKSLFAASWMEVYKKRTRENQGLRKSVSGGGVR